MADYDKVKVKKIEETTEEVIPKNENEPEKLQQVANVKKRKRGLVERAVVALIGPEGFSGVGRYIGKEVIAPAVKNIIADSVTTGINTVMFGRDGRASRNDRYSRATGYNSRHTRTNYSNVHKRDIGPAEDGAYHRATSRNRFDSEDYVLETRQEAFDVLNSLRERVDDFQQTTIADFYDAVGVTSEFTDNNWGWTDLENASVRPYRDTFVISLPRPERLS